MTKVDLRRVLDLDAQATEGPWDSTTEIGLVHEDTLWSPVGSTQADVPEATADAELIAHYRTAAPRMARALQEVLALHYELECHPDCCGEGFCDACGEVYPCPTVKAFHNHLGDQ